MQKLERLCEANSSFLVPSLEACATLCLGDELQVCCWVQQADLHLERCWPIVPHDKGVKPLSAHHLHPGGMA